MKLLAITLIALAQAVAACGCGGGAGPATPPFEPFGTDPSGASADPPGGSNETPPSSGTPQTIAQLCAADCARVAAACPAAGTADCASSCAAESTMYPGCAAELQAFYACYMTAQLTCNGSNVEASACTASAYALFSCISPGSTASGSATN